MWENLRALSRDAGESYITQYLLFDGKVSSSNLCPSKTAYANFRSIRCNQDFAPQLDATQPLDAGTLGHELVSFEKEPEFIILGPVSDEDACVMHVGLKTTIPECAFSEEEPLVVVSCWI
jgi:hypothetical protein